MKKIATIALTIALMSVVANAAIITVDPVEILTPTDGAGSGWMGGPDYDPTGLRRYTFRLVDEGPELTDIWAVDIYIASEPGGSGIFNYHAFGGGLSIDTEPLADTYTNGGSGYNKAMDTWLAHDFDWLSLPVQHDVSGPHAGFNPEIHVAASSIMVGSGVAFLQVITDGDLKWYGRDKTSGDIIPTGEIGRAGASFQTGGTTIPEPATMGLMLFGAIGMIARKRRS